MLVMRRSILKILVAVGIICINILAGIFISAIFPIQIGVFILAKIFRPDLNFFVFGLNAALATESPSKNGAFNIITIIILEGKIPSEDFRAKVNSRIFQLRDSQNKLVYQRLQETFEGFLGYTFWRDLSSTFELGNHVRDYDHEGDDLALPNPCYEEDLLRLNGPLLTVPWKEDQSPWEILIVQNYRDSHEESGKDQTALIVRTHHCLMDGYSIVECWEILSGCGRITMPKMKIERSPWDKLMLFLQGPLDAADAIIKSIDGQRCLQLYDHQRYFVTCSTPEISISSVKKIKNKFGVNYSAVVFAAFTGGLLRVMKEAGKPVPAQLATYMAWPKPNHPGRASNHAVCVVCNWRAKSDSAVKRLVEISKEMEALRYSSLPLVLDIFLLGYSFLPRRLVGFLCRKLTLTGGSILASSFPVSDKIFHFDEVKVRTTITSFTTLGDKIGISLAVAGSSGKTRLVVTMDKRILPREDLQRKLGGYIKDEIDNFLREAENGNYGTN